MGTLKLMTSQRVERTRIRTGGYRRFRGEWVNYSFVIRYFNLFFFISLQNSNQSGFLGNCPPSPPLCQHYHLLLT